jgi:hypothetical protein
MIEWGAVLDKYKDERIGRHGEQKSDTAFRLSLKVKAGKQ